MKDFKIVAIEIIIGCIAITTIATVKNNDLKKENAELRNDINYLQWQLNEVPTIIESRKSEICGGE